MRPDENFSKIVKGKRYTVKTSKLLAEGSSTGRSAHLYKTAGGAYYRIDLTVWQGEHDSLTPLTREEAMDMWEQCPDQYVEYEDAFDTIVEEAAAGRPPIYSESMKQISLLLPLEMIEWLRSKPNQSEYVRGLIDREMRFS